MTFYFNKATHRCGGEVGTLAHGTARDATGRVTPQAGVHAAVAHDEEDAAAHGAERGGRARLVRGNAAGGVVAKVSHLQRVAVRGPADGAVGGNCKICPKDIAARVQGRVLQDKVVLSLAANGNQRGGRIFRPARGGGGGMCGKGREKFVLTSVVDDPAGVCRKLTRKMRGGSDSWISAAQGRHTV